MTRTLVVGASGGIGAALAATSTGEVTTLSRRDDGLDVTDHASVDRILGALDAPFDCIWIAVGILGTPEKSLAAIDSTEMARVFAVNVIGVSAVMRHLPRLLTRAGGRAGVLSARVGSIGDNGLGGWHSYRASKAALNQVVHGAAIELGRSHKGSVVAAFHPGTVDTPFTAGYSGHEKLSPIQSAQRLQTILGTLQPQQTGRFFDHLGAEVPW